MNNMPNDETARAWARLVRVEQALMSKIEAELKEAGLPPLAWYDVLLELARDETVALRPIELEKHLLLAQHNVSRLIDRLERVGLVVRQACPDDGRGQLVAITAKGRKLRLRMWRVYGRAIATHVGSRLARDDANELARILALLV